MYVSCTYDVCLCTYNSTFNIQLNSLTLSIIMLCIYIHTYIYIYIICISISASNCTNCQYFYSFSIGNTEGFQKILKSSALHRPCHIIPA